MTNETIENQPETMVNDAPSVTVKPNSIPDKFWNDEVGELRSDDLIKSYNELENRLAGHMPVVPGSVDDYSITIEDDLFEIDQGINVRLHAAGFSNEQAQLVYDLAREQLMPMAEQVSGNLKKQSQIARLETQFGGKSRWGEMEKQLRTWGKSNLSMEAYETMSQTYDGVIAMHRMMAKNEPSILGGGHPTSSQLSESDLKNMMNDPRYWRDHDPDYVAKIQQGFELLYPS